MGVQVRVNTNFTRSTTPPNQANFWARDALPPSSLRSRARDRRTWWSDVLVAAELPDLFGRMSEIGAMASFRDPRSSRIGCSRISTAAVPDVHGAADRSWEGPRRATSGRSPSVSRGDSALSYWLRGQHVQSVATGPVAPLSIDCVHHRRRALRLVLFASSDVLFGTARWSLYQRSGLRHSRHDAFWVSPMLPRNLGGVASMIATASTSRTIAVDRTAAARRSSAHDSLAMATVPAAA